MTIVPSFECTHNYNALIEHNTYLYRNKYLSGYVLFHNIDGTFSNGWEYKDGEIVGRVLSLQKAEASGIDGEKLLLEKHEASYQVFPRLDKQSRVQTRSSGEVDGGSGTWLPEVTVVGKDPNKGKDDGSDSGDNDHTPIVVPGGGSGGSSGDTSGGYEGNDPRDPQDVPKTEKVTKENFEKEVMDADFLQLIRGLLDIDPNALSLFFADENWSPRSNASFDERTMTITIYPNLFSRGYTIYDAQSILSHEYVHYSQFLSGNVPMRDEKGNFKNKQYLFEYESNQIMQAMVIFEQVLEKYENKGEEVYIAAYSYYYQKCVQPIADAYDNHDKYVYECNEQLIKNDMEAYKFQLDHFRDTMSKILKKQTEQNYNSRAKLYSKIKDSRK